MTTSATPLLPTGHTQERLLVFILASIMYLTCLAAIIALAGMKASHTWQSTVERQFIVQIFPIAVQTPASVKDRAEQVLQSQYPSAKIRFVAQDDAQDLLGPWLETIDLPEDLTLPIIARIRLDIDDNLNEPELLAAFTEAEVQARIDQQAQWRPDILKAWSNLQILMCVIFLITIFTTLCVAGFATRAALNARRAILKVLNNVGATDGFIVRLFMLHLFKLSLLGGIIGAALAFMSFAAFGFTVSILGQSYLSSIQIGPPEFLIIIILIIVFSCLVTLIAGMTTFMKLRRS